MPDKHTSVAHCSFAATLVWFFRSEARAGGPFLLFSRSFPASTPPYSYNATANSRQFGAFNRLSYVFSDRSCVSFRHAYLQKAHATGG
jgi:hypothetical protein